MDPAFRLIYILETFLSTVPFGMLRFYAFRRELRISTQVFAFCYTLLVLGKICYLNLAFWPDLLPIEERQRFYLLVSVITNLFFFLIIRPFWRQLFVTGTLMVYATTIMYPFAYIIGNEWLGQGMLAHLVGCIYLLAGIGFTWKPMKHWEPQIPQKSFGKRGKLPRGLTPPFPGLFSLPQDRILGLLFPQRKLPRSGSWAGSRRSHHRSFP